MITLENKTPWPIIAQITAIEGVDNFVLTLLPELDSNHSVTCMCVECLPHPKPEEQNDASREQATSETVTTQDYNPDQDR